MSVGYIHLLLTVLTSEMRQSYRLSCLLYWMQLLVLAIHMIVVSLASSDARMNVTPLSDPLTESPYHLRISSVHVASTVWVKYL
jgi:hypothetical protein